MGRLAIIEDDSATSVAAAAAATSTKTSSDKSETKTKTSVAEASSSSVDTLGTKGGTNGGTNKTGTTTEVKRCCNKKLQGGISDESGYYEEDELQDDDSIEIVYDKCLAKNGDRIQHQNTANTATAGMKNTQQQHVSSSTSGAVSITPIPVSGFSSVHQPASSSNLAQGRQKLY